MFVPVKPDFRLPRFPWATTLVCVICVLVFSGQLTDEHNYEKAVDQFCDMPRSRIETMVFEQIHSNHKLSNCDDIAYILTNSADEASTLEQMMSGLKPLAGYDRDESREYIAQQLREEARAYQRMVPPDPYEGLAYYSESWNPVTMVTSTFAHGGWGHIIFNLIFFFAFGTMVEMLVSTLSFASLVLLVALVTGAFTSISAMSSGIEVSSVGLSGVVMAMIGLSAYLLPRARIRCYYWFVVLFGSIAVPVWVLALWYLGGDIYALFAFENHGAINVMAHVTGGLTGYLFGLLFLKKARAAAEGIQMTLDREELRPRFF
jgi:membrane associated rhomboid family serine protease